jgi:hypothetical protein
VSFADVIVLCSLVPMFQLFAYTMRVKIDYSHPDDTLFCHAKVQTIDAVIRIEAF